MHRINDVPLGVLIDSYKGSHPFLYPPALQRTAYGEFRRSFDNDPDDHRILVYGLRYIVETYVARRWTHEDVENSRDFYSTHNAGFAPFPFPYDLARRIVDEHDGWFPVRIEGIPEGCVIYPHTPIFVVTAEGEEWSPLVTWMETILSMVWYPTTVATLSRRALDLIEGSFVRSVDAELRAELAQSRLHDFGFRGCTSVEQAIIGGTAHLLSSRGSDTAAAAYHVQYHLNRGVPVAQTIPATEHSVMMAHCCERDAILRTIDEFGGGAFACVMDSYDYAHALDEILPSVAQKKLAKGGFMVLRPDSGDPLEAVLMALRAGERVFTATTNSLGFKVLQGCGVIQGDGIDYAQMKRILDGVMDAGFSAQNVVFGMGSGLLQRVNRDTMSFATKLSHYRDLQGVDHCVCKTPKTDQSKTSLPGRFSVKQDAKGVPVVYPEESSPQNGPSELLQVYYDGGPVRSALFDRSFDQLRQMARTNWTALPKKAQPVSAALREKASRFAAGLYA